MQTGVMHFFAGFIIPVIGLTSSYLGLKSVKTWALSVSPYSPVPFLTFALAMVNEEFPSLVAGAIGLMVSIFAANRGWGLAKITPKTRMQKRYLSLGLPKHWLLWVC